MFLFFECVRCPPNDLGAEKIEADISDMSDSLLRGSAGSGHCGYRGHVRDRNGDRLVKRLIEVIVDAKALSIGML